MHAREPGGSAYLWAPLHAPRLVRILVFAGLFTAAGYVGRATIVDGRALSLVWPAAGVAVLWYLVEDVRWRSLDILALAAITFVVNTTTGSSWAMGWVFILANVAQALAVVSLCRLWRAHLWDDDTPMATTRSLMMLVAAAMAGCVVGTAIGVTGLWLTNDVFSVAATLTWWGRNTVGVIGITVVGLLLLHRRTNPVQTWSDEPRRRGWWVELSAVVAVTGLMYLLELGLTGAPVSFLLPAVLVWVGMRFSPTVAALHGLGGGAAFVAVTLTGNGPFAGVGSLEYAALLSQLFVAASVVIGMVLSIFRVQTERLLEEVRRARETSEAQADVLVTVIDSMTEGIGVLDPDGRVRMANPSLERMLGLAIPVGTPAAEVFPRRRADGELLDEGALPASSALAGEVAPGADFVVDRPSGTGVVTVFATPLGRRGRSGTVVVLRDVTEERDHQRELTAFAGVVAHDLLNPIMTVEGWAEYLEDALAERWGEDATSERVMTQRIRGAIDRMSALIQGLLAHATSDRELQPETLDVSRIAREVAEDRGVAAHVVVDAVPPVEGDAVLVRQLLDNLIGNAAKYVPPGEPPEIRVAGAPAPGGLVDVTVADRGIGIPDGQHATVFGDFQRAHAADDYQGTGLGLAICRRIVERHGGSIAAHPRDGGGTVMELTLPAAATTPRQRETRALSVRA